MSVINDTITFNEPVTFNDTVTVAGGITYDDPATLGVGDGTGSPTLTTMPRVCGRSSRSAAHARRCVLAE